MADDDRVIAKACLAAALVAGAAALGVGCVRGFSQSFLLNLTGGAIVRRVLLTIAIQGFWIPITAIAMATWRATLTRRTRLAVTCGIIAMSLLAEPAWTAAMLSEWSMSHARFWVMVASRADTNLLFTAVALGLTRVAARRAERAEIDRMAADMRTVNVRAQLYVMTLQLQPHFLFNALNLASQLAFTDVNAALETLGNLRTLLAQSLELAHTREVALSRELAFLESYTSIQTRRFRDRLKVTIDAGDDALLAAVPHLVLQPLVENAIAHGIAPVEEGGVVTINAQRTGDRVRIIVEDNGAGARTPVAEGVGLGITRRRLAQVFDDDFSLTVTRREGGGTRTIVDVPFRALASTLDVAHPEEASIATAFAPEPVEPVEAWQCIPFALRLVAIWLAAAIVWLVAGIFTSPYGDAPVHSQAIAFGSALLWATVSLIPLTMAKRFDLTERADFRRIAAHVVAAIGTTALHLAIWFPFLASIDRTQRVIQWRNRFSWVIWDLAAYASIVALVWIGALGKRLLEARREMLRVHGELVDAQLAALRLRLQPGILFRALDAASDAVRRAPEVAELAIARLGDLLRLLLRTSNHEFVTVANELELLRAYVTLTGASLPIVLSAEIQGTEADVPASITLALLDAIGETARIDFSDDHARIAIRFSTRHGAVDEEKVRDITARLRRDYGDRATLRTTSRSDGAEVSMFLPYDSGRRLSTEAFVQVGAIRPTHAQSQA